MAPSAGRAHESLQQFLNSLPNTDEKTMYQQSLQREPRGADASAIE